MSEALTLAAPRAAVPGVELIGRSQAITRVGEFVRRAAALDGGVLITAEAGSGVDSVARELHARGRHAAGPCVVVECGADEASRLDRHLFGGPPLDASSDLESVSSDSRIARACGGMLFLQDVTELPAGAQARLARIARDGEVRIDGRPVSTGFRLVASAPASIDADVDARRFRSDLYRRLAAVRIDLPPLRERREDVPDLAIRALADACAARGVAPRSFTHAALALMSALTWPGNLQELQDAVQRVVSDTSANVIQVEHLLPALRLHTASAPFAPTGSLREARTRFEREYIASVLQHHGWHMSEAARTLGIQRPNLYRKARQLGIPLPRAAE